MFDTVALGVPSMPQARTIDQTQTALTAAKETLFTQQALQLASSSPQHFLAERAPKDQRPIGPPSHTFSIATQGSSTSRIRVWPLHDTVLFPFQIMTLAVRSPLFPSAFSGGEGTSAVFDPQPHTGEQHAPIPPMWVACCPVTTATRSQLTKEATASGEEAMQARAGDIATLAQVIPTSVVRHATRIQCKVIGVARVKLSDFDVQRSDVRENISIVDARVTLLDDEHASTTPLQTLEAGRAPAPPVVSMTLPTKDDDRTGPFACFRNDALALLAKVIPLLAVADLPASMLADVIVPHLALSLPQRRFLLQHPSLSNRIDLLHRQVHIARPSSQPQSLTVAGKALPATTSSPAAAITTAFNASGPSSTSFRQPDVQKLCARLLALQLDSEVQETITQELVRLDRLSPTHHESDVLLAHVKYVLDLPWHEQATSSLDIHAAKKQLDADHFGLAKVKRRILEFIAVSQRPAPSSAAAMQTMAKGPILALVGPPGCGKTSLAASIAKSLQRPMQRISLGGVRDEADIRGHRKTYVGAMPGRIMQAMKKAKCCNPVILLDEVDKIGSHPMGNPSDALLEVLDPAQNHAFHDHYVGVPFPLHRAFFIVTANTLETIPRPLLDRMEVIQVPAYTMAEKLQIGRDFLLPRRKEECHVAQLELHDDVLRSILQQWHASDAGVRGLDKSLDKICRYVALERLLQPPSTAPVQLDAQTLKKILGPPRSDAKRRVVSQSRPGVVTGLAYGSHGVGSLLYVECILLPHGTGQLKLTGNLRDVIRESAMTAYYWIRSHQALLGIAKEKFSEVDMHVHFPAGAVPKDGPSAGLAVLAAMVGTLRDETIDFETAMTGEVTLHGLVLPVGGLPEKISVAIERGIQRFIVPAENAQEVRDVIRISTPPTKDVVIECHPVATVEAALALLFPALANAFGAASTLRRPARL